MNWIGIELKESESDLNWIELKNPESNFRDSPTVWPLCAFFFISLQLYVPFYVKKKKIDNFMCLLEFECAKRLKAHSRAIPATWIGIEFNWKKWIDPSPVRNQIRIRETMKPAPEPDSLDSRWRTAMGKCQLKLQTIVLAIYSPQFHNRKLM